MPPAFSPVLQQYLPAFQGHEDAPFLTFHSPTSPVPVTHTRGQLWALARRFAHVLTHHAGLRKGDCQFHLFAANSVEDVALRLAAVMVGTVPVTVNWDSDPVDRVVFKARSSQAKVVFTHAKTPADQLEVVRTELPHVQVLAVEDMLGEDGALLAEAEFEPSLGNDDTRIIIYTSGSSGEPKGVRLSYQNYVTNRATFESFLLLEDPASRFTPILANPLHHTNSTALSDWALRRPGTHLHLFERYTTSYWATVARVATGTPLDASEAPLPADAAAVQALVATQQATGLRVVCPAVSRHFDFLESLVQEGRLGLPTPDILKWIAPVVTFLLGSAPVGPATVSRLLTYLGRLPTVRFGSTETCLQVVGTPLSLSQDVLLEAFQRGWAVAEKEGGGGGGGDPGFYIGRPHPPYTEVMVVEGIDPTHPATYLKECGEGVRGYLVTRGNLMKGYVQGEEATRKAIHYDAGGWYTNLGDICFWLANAQDPGAKDFYWVTRTSNLLIRGGTNYSYEQISNELSGFVSARYGLPKGAFALAAVGLRVSSEHDDDCLVTVELLDGGGEGKREDILATFVPEAKAQVSKGAKPSRLRLGAVPRNFKGDVQWRELEAAWKKAIEEEEKETK